MKNSIIIPVYNEKSSLNGKIPYIEGMFDGLTSTLKNGIVSRIDIIDDGSDDGTYEYICSFIKNIENLNVWQLNRVGKAKAARYGINLVKETIDNILFLDGDIINYEPYVAEQMFDELKNCKMVIGLVKQMGDYVPAMFSGIRALNIKEINLVMESELAKKYFQYSKPIEGYGFDQFYNLHFLKEAHILTFDKVDSRSRGGKYDIRDICRYGAGRALQIIEGKI